MTQTSFDPQRSVAVYGALRSGTTLLRLMLDANPKLACPGETDFIFDYLRHADATAGYDEVAMERDRIYRAHREKYADTPLPALTPDALIERIAGDDQIAVLMLHRKISKALAVYPDMRILHFLRDPRDVARSSIGMGWAGNVYYGVDHWIDTEQDWARIASQIAPEQVLTIHYEDLIGAPEDTLRKICAFLDVNYDPQMLEYDKGSSYAKPSQDLTLQWKRKQSAYEVGLVEAKIGDLLTGTGYAPSGHALQQPTGPAKLRLQFENRRAKWKTRVARYGLFDAVMIGLGQKLGLPALSANASRRIDEEARKHLK